MSPITWTLMLLAASSLADPAAAQCSPLVPDEARLLPVDGGPVDLFGFSTAISGDRIAIGAVWDNDDGSQAGSVWIYAWDGTAWQVEDRLIGDDTAAGDNFGRTVALDGDTLLVGAWRADAAGTDSGAAYVFRRGASGWAQEAKLVGSDTAEEDLFGSGVALLGNTAVVGGWWHDTDGLERAGKVYVFRFDGLAWAEVDTLVASDREEGDQFGLSVALDPERIVVGAWLEQTLGVAAGAVYVFREQLSGQWLEEQKLLGSQGTNSDRLGRSVAVEGSTLVFGGSAHGSQPGSAYVFEHDGSQWLETERLSACDGVDGDNFGVSVALSGDDIIVGAGWRFAQEAAPGAAYHFVRSGTGWQEHRRWTARGNESGDQFGISVAMHAGRAVVGANWSGASGPQSGAAYTFDLESGPGENYCTATENAAGRATWMGATGSEELASSDLTLRAFLVPPGRHGLFFYGSRPAHLPFGDGYLCISPFAPGLIRLNPLVHVGPSGVAERAIAYEDLPSSGTITAGSTWYFQFWYRDGAAGGAGFNLSDGLRITFR